MTCSKERRTHQLTASMHPGEGGSISSRSLNAVADATGIEIKRALRTDIIAAIEIKQNKESPSNASCTSKWLQYITHVLTSILASADYALP